MHIPSNWWLKPVYVSSHWITGPTSQVEPSLIALRHSADMQNNMIMSTTSDGMHSDQTPITIYKCSNVNDRDHIYNQEVRYVLFFI